LAPFIRKAKYYFSTDIVKDPSLTLLHKELSSIFPKSQYVFIIRDPRQNIRSILNRLRIPGNLNDLSETEWNNLENKLQNWHIVVEGSLSGHKGNSYIENLALRWCKFFDIYDKNREKMILIRYEDFNQNKVSTVQDLAKKLNLQTTGMTKYIKDRQFQPKGNSNIDLLEFFGDKNLSKIEDICGEKMINIGYSLIKPIK